MRISTRWPLLAELVRPDRKRLLGDALQRLTPNLVVVPGLENFDFVVAHSVHQPMFVVDPAGPVSRQLALEWFRFTDTAERIALDLCD